MVVIKIEVWPDDDRMCGGVRSEEIGRAVFSEESFTLYGGTKSRGYSPFGNPWRVGKKVNPEIHSAATWGWWDILYVSLRALLSGRHR